MNNINLIKDLQEGRISVIDAQTITDSLSSAISQYSPNSAALYQALHFIHTTAKSNNVPILYPDSVSGNPKKQIQLTMNSQTSPIPLPEQTDFNGWTFKVINVKANEEPLFRMYKTLTTVSGVTKAMIDSGNFSSITELSSGNKMLVVHDSAFWTYRNDTPDTYFPGGVPGTPWQDWTYTDDKKKYRDDVLLIKDGIAQNHTIAPYNTAASSPTCKYVAVSENLSYIKNIILHCAAESIYSLKLVKIECINHLLLSNITVDIPSTNTLYNCSSITIINTTNLTIEDCTINNTYSSVNAWGYGIDMNNVWNVDIIRMHATSPKWGVFGNNNVNTLRLRDCDINRFDIHCYGSNITCVGCTFQNDNYLAEAANFQNGSVTNEVNYHIYNRFSSLYGYLTYENCLFNGFYPFITDYAYNIYSGCCVSFRNCTMRIYQNKYAYLFKMGFWGAPANLRAEHAHRCFHNVLIDGMKFILQFNDITNVYMFFLMDRFDWNWGSITENIHYTSSLHVRNIHFVNASNADLSTATLKEKNLEAHPVSYQQNVLRLTKINDVYTSGEFLLNNGNF